MKKILKKATVLLVMACILLSLFTVNVFAAGTSSIAFSKNDLKIGDTLTVTVRFNATEPMYAVQGFLKYDPKVFQFVSGDNSSSTAAGVAKIVLSSNGKTALTENIQFKAIAVGKSTFSLTDSVYVAETEQKILNSSASAQVKDTSASKSSNANLTFLRITAGTLTPAFSVNTTNYNVTVPYSVTEVLVYTDTEDKNATVAIEGSKTMKVGANKRVVKVTATDGTVKSYTINITRLANEETSSNQTSSAPTTSEPVEPTPSEKIIVDGEEKFISENFSQELVYEGFALTTYKYNDKEYPAITDGGTTLLYLVDSEGKNGAFFRVDKQSNITKFNTLLVGKNMYQILSPDENDLKDDYIQTKVTIGGKEYDAYQRVSDKNSEFVFFFAKFGDNTGLYRYDMVENTMQRAEGLTVLVSNEQEEPGNASNGNWLENLKNLNSNGKIVAITIVSILLLLIAAIIIIIIRLVTSGRDNYYDDEYEEIGRAHV